MKLKNVKDIYNCYNIFYSNYLKLSNIETIHRLHLLSSNEYRRFIDNITPLLKTNILNALRNIYE